MLTATDQKGKKSEKSNITQYPPSHPLKPMSTRRLCLML